MRRINLPADGSLPPPEGRSRILVMRTPPGPQMLERPAPMLRILVEGEERFDVDGRPHHLTPGCMMLIPAGAPIRLSAAEGSRSVSLELAQGEVDVSLPGALLLPLVSHPVGEWLEQVAATLHDAEEEGREEAASDALDDLATRIAVLAGHSLDQMAGLDAAKDITRLDLLGRVEAARAHLDANLHRAVPLWELEEAARLSGFHLSRAFRDAFKISPGAYHRTRRMAQAADLIRAGSSPADVSRRLGFSSQASFTRAFSRHHGHPPGQAKTTSSLHIRND